MTQKSRENYLRVTSILYPFSGLQNVNRDVLTYAAERGTKVHEICEAIMHDLGEHGVDEETWGYVESFKKWWDQGHKTVCIEQRFWCDDLEITGQVDVILETPEGLAVLDLKTCRSVSSTWAAQGSAYAYLAKKAGYDIKKIYFLHLNRHGKKARLVEYPVDDSFFISIYRTFNHFFRKRNE